MLTRCIRNGIFQRARYQCRCPIGLVSYSKYTNQDIFLATPQLTSLHSYHIFKPQVQRYSSMKLDGSTSFNVQDDDDFNARVLSAKIPIIVDFHAEWCGPCKFLGPKLEKEVDLHSGKVMLAKVDVDDLGDIAMKYKIMAVPTMMLFKDGKVVQTLQGNVDDDVLKNFVNQSLK